MKRQVAVLGALVVLFLCSAPMPATAATTSDSGVFAGATNAPELDIPGPDVPGLGLPGVGDCKEAPTPDMPGEGVAGFFAGVPDQLPKQEDPFKAGSSTTIYEQYGFGGMRWTTYDLGCGPDAMRNPDAIVGTAIANWTMQVPLALTALTSSLTRVAFQPVFLNDFDPIIEKVSTALHDSLFVAWAPVVLVLSGAGIILLARRAALASTAAALGWSVLVILLATAIFRWPVGAGHVADQAVTQTLGAVVSKLDGRGGHVDSGTAVASNVNSSILYRGWLAGTLGSADSPTAKKYGPALFKAHALTWAEAANVQKHPEEAKKFIDAKQNQWKETASQIEREDPSAYEYLTGKRSEARVGYAIIAAVGAMLALPFLLVSSLLMLGCFLIVRLAVMMFPAFATLGLFPAGRGIVLGLGRTVGAAVINAIVFGVGAGVTVVVLGLLLNPGGGAPAWLGLVLMPLFSFIMWVALKPFRRLTSMVTGRDHFATMAGAPGDASRQGSRWAKRATATAVGAYTGGVAAAATMAALEDEPPNRAEAQPSAPPPPGIAAPKTPVPAPPASIPQQRTPLAIEGAASADASSAGERPPSSPGPSAPRVHEYATTQAHAAPAPAAVGGFSPHPTEPAFPTAVEPELDEGEEIYPIYRGTNDEAPVEW